MFHNGGSFLTFTLYVLPASISGLDLWFSLKHNSMLWRKCLRVPFERELPIKGHEMEISANGSHMMDGVLKISNIYRSFWQVWFCLPPNLEVGVILNSKYTIEALTQKTWAWPPVSSIHQVNRPSLLLLHSGRGSRAGASALLTIGIDRNIEER